MGYALEKLPDWPAAMNRETALAYTSVSEAQMKVWEKSGAVRFLARGPHNAQLALREDLDAALRQLFEAGNDDTIEFD